MTTENGGLSFSGVCSKFENSHLDMTGTQSAKGLSHMFRYVSTLNESSQPDKLPTVRS